jgi:hypothetical protein
VRSIKHPLSGALYDLRPDGHIDVTKGDHTGVFTSHGVYVSGDLRHADAHLCLWIGGTQLPNRFQQAAEALNAAH